MTLKRGKTEDAASFIGRAILQGVEERAEFIYVELKEHYLLIRLRWGPRMRMIWRGTGGERLELMAYLKGASGMSAAECRVPQEGAFSFTYRGERVTLPAVCKPYITEERVILSLWPLLREDGDTEKPEDREDELRPEYDTALLKELMKNGVRGKYVERYRQGTNLVKLAPDVAAAFPTEQAVNDALRKLLQSEPVSA